jgi:two-component sensor histidine kinase
MEPGHPTQTTTQKYSVKTVNNFCIAIAIFSLLGGIAYALFGFYQMCALEFMVSIAFSGFVYLNYKSYFKAAKLMVIFTTNFGVLCFSAFLGFHSGIYLYLFAAQLIIYTVFDFKNQQMIYLCLLSYILTFGATFFIDYFELVKKIELTQNASNVIYGVNFSSALILCFILIKYFININKRNTDMLKETNLVLQEHQVILQNEIDAKNKAHKEVVKILKEKEILFSEIHHRVKNNLAVISGLIELQNFYIKDPHASAILKESRNRIKSIALLHEKLYESESLDQIGIRAYVDELIYFIKLSFEEQNKEVRIHAQIDNITLSLKEALPFSLLLNELMTNAYKHAFNQQDEGNIYISLAKNQNELTFHFKDDGSGFIMPMETKEDSLGMNLIEAFATQLEGTMKYESNKGIGTNYRLQFKLE